MAYAMKRNAGRPKQRARRMAGKTSSHFAKGFALAKRVGKGSDQKMIRKSVFAYIRANGSAEEQRLGLADNSDAARDFRLGIRDAAGQLAGFNPSAGSDRDARIETAAYKGKASSSRKSSGSSSRKRIKMPNGSFRYMVDGKFASKAAYDAAGGKSGSKSSSKRDVSSMSWGDLRKKAGARYKVGMTRVEVEEIVSGARSNPRKRLSRQTAMVPKSSRKAMPLGSKEQSTYGMARGVSVSADYFANPDTGDNFIEFNLISFPGDMEVLGEPFEGQHSYTMFANYDQRRGVWTYNAPHATGTLAGTTLKQLANEVAEDLAVFFSGVAPDGTLIERERSGGRQRIPRKAELVRWGQEQAKAAKGHRDAKGRFTKRKNPRNFGAEFLFI